MQKTALALVLSMIVVMASWSVRAAEPGSIAVVLVVDTSGSMKKNDPEKVRFKAIERFIKESGDVFRIGLVTFDSKAKKAFPLTTMTMKARPELLATLGGIKSDGKHTHFAAGLEEALYTIKQLKKKAPTVYPAVVFFTDGKIDPPSSAGDAKKSWQRILDHWLPTFEEEHVPIYSIAFTDKADFTKLGEMSSATGGEWYKALEAKELPGMFSQCRKDILAAYVASTKKDAPAEPAAPVATQDEVEPTAEPASPAAQTLETTAPLEESKGLPMGVILAAVGVLVLLGLLVVILLVAKRRPAGAEETPRAKAAGEITAKLVPSHPEKGYRTFPITLQETCIGKGADQDLVLLSPYVSATHALLHQMDDRLFVTDLGSKNGTFVNNVRLQAETKRELRDGDHLRFDKEEFRVQILSGSDTVARSFDVDALKQEAGIGATMPLEGVVPKPKRGKPLDLDLDDTDERTSREGSLASGRTIALDDKGRPKH